MKHDYTSVKNIYIICGKTDMRNYAKSTIMGSRDPKIVYYIIKAVNILPIIFYNWVTCINP